MLALDLGRPAALQAGQPITPAEFAALMAPLGPWPRSRRVGVAVSGGADSLCLAWLASRWGRPVAMIVDHGLRSGSDQEAALALRRLEAFGVPARIIRLTGLRPGDGNAARARAARYAALARAATSLDLPDLLVAHHALDQAETVLIRGQAGSGAAGMAGMAAIVEQAAVRLVRPLLGVPPARLRATLRAERIEWSEDPSNRNMAALRPRVRRDLDDPEGEGARTRLLAQQAASAGRVRGRREAEAASRLARQVCLFPEAYAVLAPGDLDAECLAALIRTISGSPYPHGSAAIARLAASMRDGRLRGTIGGVHFAPAGRLGPGIPPGTLVVRELAATQPPVPALDGALWDRRFRLRAGGPLPDGAEIGALGADACRVRKYSDLPSLVLAALPALRVRGTLWDVPHLPGFSAVLGGDDRLRAAAAPAAHFSGWTNRPHRLTFEPACPAACAPFAVREAGDAQSAR